MWNLIIYLSFVLGLSLALQPGLEYRYSYKGRLVTGVTQKKHQLAAIGMKADVTVQVAKDNRLTMKFDNVETGDFHDEHSCHLRETLPISYKSLSIGKDLLEAPFLVSLNGKNETYLEVPSEEPAWMTNFRKAVVSVFPFQGMWEESKKSGLQRQAFGKQEELIGGQCMSWFSGIRIPIPDAVRIGDERQSEMEEDVQKDASSDRYSEQPESGKADTGVPPLEDTLWTVTRTVDYQNCDDPVEMILNGNKESEALTSRTSVSHYLMRGNYRGMRMETAVVEGVISVFTGSEESEFHIDTLTNQTLMLKSVRAIRDVITIGDSSRRRINSLRFEGDSIRSKEECPGQYAHFEEKLAGFRAGGTKFEDLKEEIFSSLAELSVPPNNMVTAMSNAAQSVSYLSFREIHSLYRLLQERIISSLNQDQDLVNFKLALLSAGTEPAIKFLLDDLERDEAFKHDAFVFDFFKQIVTTLKAPSLIPRMLEMASKTDWEIDLLKTQALTTAGSLFAMERKFRNSATWREDLCYLEKSSSFFIPYLKGEIQNPDIEPYRRVIYIQSLINTASPQILEILHPIILGAKDEPFYLRTTAMAALSSRLLPKSTHDMVYNLLTPLMENTGERTEVREMAFLVLSAWNQGPSWWKKMALSTWHEPSRQFANLVSSTIDGIAATDGEMREMMSRIAYLVKPSKGFSLGLSTNFYLKNYLSSSWPLKDLNIISFASTQGIMPTHIFVTYELQRLRGFPSVTQISSIQQNLDFFTDLAKQYLDQFRYGDEQPGGTTELFDLMDNALKQIGLNITAFPMDVAWFSKTNGNFFHAKDMKFMGGGHAYSFLGQLRNYIPRIQDKLHHEILVDTTYAYPTDLGLPFVLQYSSQKALRILNSGRPLAEDESFSGVRTAGSVILTLQLSQETFVNTKTIVPWLDSSVGSGAITEANVNVPIAFYYAGLGKTSQGFLKILIPDNDLQLLTAENYPYTALYKSLLPIKSLVERKHISKTVRGYYTNKIRAIPWTSVFRASVRGDTSHPTVSQALRAAFAFLTPSMSEWSVKIEYIRERTDFRDVTFSFTPATKKHQDPESVGGATAPSEMKEPGPSTGVAKEAEDILHQIEQLQNEESGDVISVGVSMKTSGNVDVNRRVFAILAQNGNSETLHSRLKLVWHHDVLTGFETSAYKSRADITYQRPNILPMTPTADILNKDLLSNISGKFFAEDDMVLDVKGNISVSSGYWNYTTRTKVLCIYDEDYPLLDIITADLYDNGDFEINWTENFPESWNETLHRIYSLVEEKLDKVHFGYQEDYAPGKAEVHLIKDYDSVSTDILTKGSEFALYTIKLPLLGFPATTSEALQHIVFNGRNPAVCAISSDKVHTFDGEKFPFKPNKCWKMAAADSFSGKFQIHVRHVDRWEVKVLWTDMWSFKFDLSSSSILVDGKEPNEKDERYKFAYLDNAVVVMWDIGFAIRISDKVEIQVPFSSRSNTIGLCGKYDGDRKFEILGPKGCSYSNYELFASAWELLDDECNALTYDDTREVIEDYQNNCPKGQSFPTSNSYDNGQITCTSYEYQVRNEGKCSCRALEPTPKCNTDCISEMETQKKIQFQCRPTADHGAEDRHCNLKTYVVSYPTACGFH